MPTTAPSLPPVSCPWCEHTWTGRDTFITSGIFIPHHQCGHRHCRKWFAVVYRATVEWEIGPAGRRPVVSVTLEGVGKSYGKDLPALLDTLTALQRQPGVTLTHEEIQAAVAFALVTSREAAA